MSWCLRGCFQALQRPIMIPKLVRMGKMHPEVARRTASSKKAIAYWFTLTAAVSAFLAYHNVVRMTFFLVFTTLALPLFKAVAFPRCSPCPCSCARCATACGGGKVSRNCSWAWCCSRRCPPRTRR